MATNVYPTAQRLAPLLSGLLLVGFVCWVVAAANARGTIESLEGVISSGLSEGSLRSAASLRPTAYAVLLAFGLACVAACVMLVGLFVGRKKSRSLRSWLLFSVLVCGWLAAALAWKDIYWLGQRMRISAEVAAAEAIALSLDREWPEGDGDHPELGVILGYPKESPTTLLLAGEPVAVGRLRIVAIEKSENGNLLRFQLAAPDNDTWLVRSSRGQQPDPFVDGFHTKYTATRTWQLSNKWFIVISTAR